MDLRQCRWLVIDTETTGPDPDTARVVEIGVARVEAMQIGWTHSRLVNPGVPIPEGAAAVHGITDDMVVDAPPIAEVADAFLANVRKADVLVGYNALHFDFPILARELGEGWSEAIEGKHLVDPLVLVRLPDVGKFWPGKGRHRLTSVAERWGIEAEGAHRAAADCVMTAKVLIHLLDGFGRGGMAYPMISTQAHELSKSIQGWALDQEEDFRRYRERRGAR